MTHPSPTNEERIFDAAEGSPWEPNGDGLWCPNCGDIISPRWFFDDDDYEPPASCRQCGFPDFGA